MTDSRRKGRAGEQELARLLRDELGAAITRNWQQQAAVGGQDLLGLDGYAVEVKRYATATFADLERWWRQAVAQAPRGAVPVLAWRCDRCPWRFLVPGDARQSFAMAHEMSLAAFVQLVRRRQRRAESTTPRARA